ncbi:unnamed protein product [Xylocopa violacea]|uniref:Retroviral polymerase SH3-like domain-containing protein n=1 Tax=Xylocopa violacea TaxID=135666 RepID=A0ABP1NBW6_XYLVO
MSITLQLCIDSKPLICDNSYRVWNPKTRRVYLARDVKFIEHFDMENKNVDSAADINIESMMKFEGEERRDEDVERRIEAEERRNEGEGRRNKDEGRRIEG